MNIQRSQNSRMSYPDSNSRIGTGQKKEDPILSGFSHKQERDAHTINRMLESKNEPINMPKNSLINQSIEYANTLQAMRKSSKNTANAVKKLKYDFKAISAQILRSKTSLNAKQVAGKARRAVLRLKREKQSGGYDEEELQAAISHAQAMERIAKKKARHLQQEELIHVDDSEQSTTVNPYEATKTDVTDDREYTEEWDAKASVEMTADSEAEETIEIQEFIQAMDDRLFSEEMLDQFMDEFGEAMEGLLEEAGLGDVLEDLIDVPEQTMSKNDFKTYQQKHRLEEQKAMAKADAEYMKAVFEKYQEARSNAVSLSVGSVGFGGGSDAGSLSGPVLSFDVSI